jgi:hypothetical protein
MSLPGSAVCSTLVLALTGLSAQAAAQALPANPFVNQKIYVAAGLFLPDRKVRLGLDGQVGDINTNVDFSRQFAMDGTDESAALELIWRLGDKWTFRGQYFRVDDENTVTLTDDIEWGEYTLNAGTDIGAGSEVQISRFFFGRGFRDRTKSEFGFGVGLHWLSLDAFIRGQAFIIGVDQGVVTRAVNTEGPLPNFGAWYAYAFTEKWALRTRLDWFSASVDKYDGQIVNAGLSVNYSMTQHFGAGLGYNLFELDIGVDDGDWQGRINSSLNGLYVYLSAYW